MGFLKMDLLNEKVTIQGKEYLLTNKSAYNPETGYISFIAECEGKKMLIDCKILDSEDPECYDIENPECITDIDSGEEIYRKESEYEWE